MNGGVLRMCGGGRCIPGAATAFPRRGGWRGAWQAVSTRRDSTVSTPRDSRHISPGEGWRGACVRREVLTESRPHTSALVHPVNGNLLGPGGEVWRRARMSYHICARSISDVAVDLGGQGDRKPVDNGVWAAAEAGKVPRDTVAEAAGGCGSGPCRGGRALLRWPPLLWCGGD